MTQIVLAHTIAGMAKKSAAEKRALALLAAKQLNAPSTITRTEKMGLLFGVGGIVVSCVPSALSAAGIVYMDAAHYILIAATVLAIMGAVVIEYLSARTWKRIFFASVTTGIAVGGFLFMIDRWMVNAKARQDAKSQQDALASIRTSGDAKPSVTSSPALQSSTTPLAPAPPASLPDQSKAIRPDISLRLVYPGSLAVVLINTSKTLLNGPKYSCGLWNLDSQNYTDPLPVPGFTGDWIRPQEAMGPLQFVGNSSVFPLIKIGDRLAGFVITTCPDCVRSKTYLFFAVHGKSGWFSEVSKGRWVNIQAFHQALPEMRKNPEAFFADIPQSSRKLITNLVP